MRQRITERVVTIGGGTGSFAMLSELKKVADQLCAVVAMTDSGGSSRRLMDEFGRPLPLGDLRQALVAMSRSSRLWGEVFSYRFPSAPNGEVGGHSLGNLILHALEDRNGGDLLGALEDAQEMLHAAGQVVPVTLERATLCAELADGSVVRGEAEIDCPGERAIQPIRRVFLEPAVAALPRACKALARADKVLIGPGDLYTSIVPCLLAEGIAAALRSCDGELVYVCNVMTKRGETDHYGAGDFLRVIHQQLGRRVDAVVVNTAVPDPQVAARYALEGALPVAPELERLREMVPQVIAGPFMMAETLARHDAERVVLALWPQLAAAG
ncbi:MAG: YvcK family protein [Piscinibacter sp.]